MSLPLEPACGESGAASGGPTRPEASGQVAPEGLLSSLWAVLRRPVPPSPGGRLPLGWACAALLVVLGLSGALLSVYYLPSVEGAAPSVRFLAREVSWGWLVRGFHRWSSTLLIALAGLQAVRVFYRGSYRGTRAGSWALGTVLLLLCLGLAFTGELLPWDASSLALASAALHGTEALPAIGPPLAGLMRGGAEVGAATLARAHAAHTLVLPWMAFGVLVLELWFLARRHRRSTEITRTRDARQGREEGAR